MSLDEEKGGEETHDVLKKSRIVSLLTSLGAAESSKDINKKVVPSSPAHQRYQSFHHRIKIGLLKFLKAVLSNQVMHFSICNSIDSVGSVISWHLLPLLSSTEVLHETVVALAVQFKFYSLFTERRHEKFSGRGTTVAAF